MFIDAAKLEEDLAKKLNEMIVLNNWAYIYCANCKNPYYHIYFDFYPAMYNSKFLAASFNVENSEVIPLKNKIRNYLEFLFRDGFILQEFKRKGSISYTLDDIIKNF